MTHEVPFFDQYMDAVAAIKRIKALHHEENGKCMGCPTSLRRDGVMVYDSYPCINIRTLGDKV
jgi:hypothetical protein